MGWKDIPRVIKVILVFFYISAFAQLISMLIRPNRVAVIFGFTIQPSISLFIYIIFFVIFVFSIIAIHRRIGWKFLLAFISLYTINYLINSIVVLTTPISKLAEKLNTPPIVNLSEQAIFQARLISSITAGVIFILLLIALIYLFKNREYFSNSEKIV